MSIVDHFKCFLLAGFLLGPQVAAQELPLKREIPGIGIERCTAEPAVPTPTAEERAQAVQLGSDAGRAVILGDRARARDLLERATDLDPSSPGLAYQYGRVLEELGQRQAAMDQYCHVLALDENARDAADVRTRLDELSAAERAAIPEAAVAEFQQGLASVDAGGLQAADDALSRAVALAPTWADAYYDRGVVRADLGRREEAAADLSRYLELRPDAPDALQVSQRLGQLQTPLRLPSPGGALVLGLIPGMGHFYTGRPLAGLTVLGAVGASAAAAFLIKDVEVRCLAAVEPGEDCPPSQILEEVTTRPFKTAGLGVAAAVTVIGAIEAFVRARGRRSEASREPSIGLGEFQMRVPDLAARGLRLDLRLIRLAF